MTDKDIIHERGRSLEDDYFRKKDRQLVEKIQRAAEAERARADISRAAGLSDPALADELLALGFTAETVPLLPIVPIVQVAWAEGGVSPAERDLIVRFARSRGIAEGSAADTQLSAWLSARPSEDVFASAGRLIRAMLDSGGGGGLSPDELVAYCENIASASGGVFGIGKISGEERKLLSKIVADLKDRQS